MENKLVRICWNGNDWQRPSGAQDKSTQGSYESRYGFGHEEWLFDGVVAEDGYCYGHITGGLAKCHKGKTYNLYLYTRKGNMNLYVGHILNATCIDGETANEIYNEYQAKGYLDEREKEVAYIDGDCTAFRKSKGTDMFNIRFKKEDAILDNDRRELDDALLGGYHRYGLKDFDGIIKYKYSSNCSRKGKQWVDDKGYIVEFSSHRKEVQRIHKKMQNGLAEHLRTKYGYKVELEADHVDLIGRTKDSNLHYFELKTANSARHCIREAFGQILDYCHYESAENIEKLFIVGPAAPQKNDIAYMNTIRMLYNIPIYYCYFDYNTGKFDIYD